MGKSPDAFRTISEVAEWLDTQAHVLRFWESKFTQVKPVKRAGGRRYYRPADMLLLGGIKQLLHEDGMTIKGAQKMLREQGIKHVAAMSPPLDDALQAEIGGDSAALTIAMSAALQEVEEPTVIAFQPPDTSHIPVVENALPSPDEPIESEPTPIVQSAPPTEPEPEAEAPLEPAQAAPDDAPELALPTPDPIPEAPAQEPIIAADDTAGTPPAETTAQEAPQPEGQSEAQDLPSVEITDQDATAPPQEPPVFQRTRPVSDLVADSADSVDAPPRSLTLDGPNQIVMTIPDDPDENAEQPAGLLSHLAGLSTISNENHAPIRDVLASLESWRTNAGR